MKNFKTTLMPSRHHKNRYTDEIIHQAVEVCNACHLNFLTTAAGDKHRTGKPGNRSCLTPKEAKLIKIRNKYGAIIYKTRTDPDPRWEWYLVAA
jgi:hypothetical protein